MRRPNLVLLVICITIVLAGMSSLVFHIPTQSVLVNAVLAFGLFVLFLLRSRHIH